ncbi:phosphonate transport system permease protein [Ferrimonas sediminum]|uniref:Phosphonate transport system permease protein n=1 Tax=Ferrimonas sediminum TaxID=718193 RepID=A0A1G8TSR8_9GAMM|nr:ABC transporter permease subunit [Ferrimonas sediminum]SDJ43965.1 phosphonate transport system permease protein [Ferrimonas sediminum]
MVNALKRAWVRPKVNRAAEFRRISFWLALAALACLPFADLTVYQLSPATELGRLLVGMATPDFLATEYLVDAVFTTLAFALQGITLAALSGFGLSLLYQLRGVRILAALLRSVHELFWALLFLQLFGLSALTGVLALWLPYTGIFTKVFGEILEEVDRQPEASLPKATTLSQEIGLLLYSRLPLAWPHFKHYARYRLECGMRSSVVLGFVGLPTLGYHLETAFRQGHYAQASALLYLFYLLIATMKWWCRGALLPLYLLASLWFLPPIASINWDLVIQFVSQDMVPAPLRAEHWQWSADLQPWLMMLWQEQILPGLTDTLLLSQMALLLTALLALVWFPLRSRWLLPKSLRALGQLFLIVTRSTPEFVLAFVGLLMFGPSLLPALLALGIHNGAIIAHLIGGYSQTLSLRADDTPKGLSRTSLYLYQILPRVYPQFVTWLLYRWEIIQRETAILGVLGITTLGFYIDSAFEEFRFDRALVLIVVTALLNLLVDAIARRLRARLQQPRRLQHRDA